MSGYVYCACGTCFDITVASDNDTYAMCFGCEEAECQPGEECCQESELDEDAS